MQNRLTGSFVALITPFNRDHSINFEGFRALLKFQEDNGTRAVLIMGSDRRKFRCCRRTNGDKLLLKPQK